MKAQYSLEHRKGTRPFGATFSFAPTEQPEPIDYNAHEIRLNAERSTADWSLQLGYVGSILRNEIDVMTFDNPFQAVDASGNPAAGRIDLYPNNNYHQGTIGGVVRLPANSRFSATASWGVSSQNDELIPFTTNTALTGVPSLPARTADARFETLVFNTTLSSRPVPDLTLGLRYRLYDRNNESKDRTITGYVRTDQSVSVVARRNVPIAYSRQNLAADASWAIRSDVTLRGGYEWEGWERDFRETLSTDENTLGASLDVVPVNWLSVRAAYRRSDKTANDYGVERVIEDLFPNGEPAGGLSPLHELRKLDQASRERNRAELIARLIPGDKLDLTATYTLTDDNYDESQYGVLDNDNRGPAVEVSYSVTPQFSVFADYARDTNRGT